MKTRETAEEYLQTILNGDAVQSFKGKKKFKRPLILSSLQDASWFAFEKVDGQFKVGDFWYAVFEHVFNIVETKAFNIDPAKKLNVFLNIISILKDEDDVNQEVLEELVGMCKEIRTLYPDSFMQAFFVPFFKAISGLINEPAKLELYFNNVVFHSPLLGEILSKLAEVEEDEEDDNVSEEAADSDTFIVRNKVNEDGEEEEEEIDEEDKKLFEKEDHEQEFSDYESDEDDQGDSTACAWEEEGESEFVLSYVAPETTKKYSLRKRQRYTESDQFAIRERKKVKVSN